VSDPSLHDAAIKLQLSACEDQLHAVKAAAVDAVGAATQAVLGHAEHVNDVVVTLDVQRQRLASQRLEEELHARTVRQAGRGASALGPGRPRRSCASRGCQISTASPAPYWFTFHCIHPPTAQCSHRTSTCTSTQVSLLSTEYRSKSNETLLIEPSVYP
jgi:hypothetical protein